MYDNITTRELDNLSALVCASMESTHYGYSKLAGRILVNDLQKEHKMIFKKQNVYFTEKMNYINDNIKDFLSSEFIKFINDN